MKDLLVSAPAATKPSDKKDKPDDVTQGKKDSQPNTENITEGSSIKVSISQDSLTKSPQHKQLQHPSAKKPQTAPTSGRTMEGLSSIKEKSMTLEKKKSRKGSRLAERFHKQVTIFEVWNYRIYFVSISHVKLQLYEFPDNGKTNRLTVCNLIPIG